jgi:hypothetical protein
MIVNIPEIDSQLGIPLGIQGTHSSGSPAVFQLLGEYNLELPDFQVTATIP